MKIIANVANKIDYLLDIAKISDELEISNQSYEDWLENEFTNLDVALEDNNLIGYIIYLDNGDEIEILSIVTKKEFRNQKVATLLLKSIQTHKKDIFLEVNVNNKQAINLYQSNGYINIGIRKNYYLDTSDALIYKKEIR